MSLIDALLDEPYTKTLHSEVRHVVKEYQSGETFTVVGDLVMQSISSVGQGDPGYFGKLFDRIDERVYMKIFISEEDYALFEDFYDLNDIPVCVWGKKIIRKLASTKSGKVRNEISYNISLVRPIGFLKKFDMY